MDLQERPNCGILQRGGHGVFEFLVEAQQGDLLDDRVGGHGGIFNPDAGLLKETDQFLMFRELCGRHLCSARKKKLSRSLKLSQACPHIGHLHGGQAGMVQSFVNHPPAALDLKARILEDKFQLGSLPLSYKVFADDVVINGKELFPSRSRQFREPCGNRRHCPPPHRDYSIEPLKSPIFIGGRGSAGPALRPCGYGALLRFQILSTSSRYHF